MAFALTIVAETGGTTNPSPGTHSYAINTVVSISQTANSGYQFAGWTVDGTSWGPEYPTVGVTMNTDHSVTARFSPIGAYNLNLTVQIIGNGSVTPYDTGTHQIPEYTNVNETAHAAAGWQFDHWESSFQQYYNPHVPVISFQMTDNGTLKAYFTQTTPPPLGQHRLTITAENCTTNPAAGSYDIDAGQTGTVIATPNSGYAFKRWLLDGNVAGTDPTITITMDSDHTLAAVSETSPGPTPTPTPKPIFPRIRSVLSTIPLLQRVYDLIDQKRMTTSY